MKNCILFLSILLLLTLLLTMSGCSKSDGNNNSSSNNNSPENAGDTINVDLTAGGASSCFAGLPVDTLPVQVMQKGETKEYNFEGVSLDAMLANIGVSEFTKIELTLSDSKDNMDITDTAKAPAGVFMAWSESGIPETPVRVFPKDAATGNLLIRNVTAVIITK